ncbi:MAG: DNA repair protein RadA [Candidatus Sericytochromatia bacterium]|nr:DNA repair protein RadA [Candidatus Sericytochromatia bacterium]
MSKARVQYTCGACGIVQPRSYGRCPSCEAWNSFVEERVAGGAGSRPTAASGARPLAITQVPAAGHGRVATGLAEFDRVLGGGIVPGALMLLGGEPGAGKSTLTMQVSAALARQGRQVLYLSGEESAQQIRLRADRLDALDERLHLLCESDMPTLIEAIRGLSPDFVVVDSIQAMQDPELSSVPGSVSQVREAALQFQQVAKRYGIPMVLVGHVTKEGTLAGPRVLEHLVDTVLSFEGDRYRAHRILRSLKNRYGSTLEVGVFEMTGQGLSEVADPSALFLAERTQGASGSAVAVLLEGSRPLLLEVQALVAPTSSSSPRRAANGLEQGRLIQILAVLDRRVGLHVTQSDVHANVVGGLSMAEPAGDLALALAVVGAARGLALPDPMVAIGEIGLGAEVRRVGQIEARLHEAAKLGFTQALIPRGNLDGLDVPDPLVVHGIGHLTEALPLAFPSREPA